jgi:hypothetical protein
MQSHVICCMIKLKKPGFIVYNGRYSGGLHEHSSHLNIIILHN